MQMHPRIGTAEDFPKAGKQAGWFVAAAAAAVLLALILWVGHGLAGDEPFYRMTIYDLHNKGFSLDFLQGNRYSAPGPLFALVQAATEPFTGLQAPGMRLVSVCLSGGAIFLLALLLRHRGTLDAAGTAMGGILCAPLGWAAYGMAVTEPPALLMACAGLLVLTIACEREESFASGQHASGGIGLAVLGGLLLGVAVCGRQVFVAILPALVLLVRLRGRGWQMALAAGLGMAILPAGLFWVWGGMTAPPMRWNVQGIRPKNLVLAPAFAGICVLVLAPRFYLGLRFPRAIWTAVATAAGAVVVANLFGRFFVRNLPRFVFGAHTPEPIARVYGGVILVASILFLAVLAYRAWERRENAIYVFWCGAAALLVVAPAKIPFGFEVRWLVSSLPLLVLVTAQDAPPTLWRAGRWIAGAAVSALLFNGYLHNRYAGDGSQTPPEVKTIVDQMQES